MKIEFSYQERQNIYLELIELWKNSKKISYKDLENWQLKKYSEIVWKAGTLRSKFSRDNINTKKGINEKLELLGDRQEVLGVERESQPDTLTYNQYDKILDTVNDKYRSQSEDLREVLFKAIKSMDIKTVNKIDQMYKTLGRSRAFELKLKKIVDIETYNSLEIEALKLLELRKINGDKTTIMSE